MPDAHTFARTRTPTLPAPPQQVSAFGKTFVLGLIWRCRDFYQCHIIQHGGPCRHSNFNEYATFPIFEPNHWCPQYSFDTTLMCARVRERHLSKLTRTLTETPAGNPTFYTLGCVVFSASRIGVAMCHVRSPSEPRPCPHLLLSASPVYFHPD